MNICILEQPQHSKLILTYTNELKQRKNLGNTESNQYYEGRYGLGLYKEYFCTSVFAFDFATSSQRAGLSCKTVMSYISVEPIVTQNLMSPVSLHDSSRISETWKTTTKQFFRCEDTHASLELLYLIENINDAGPYLFADPLFCSIQD